MRIRACESGHKSSSDHKCTCALFRVGASGAKVLRWLKHGFAFNGARRCRCGCCHSVISHWKAAYKILFDFCMQHVFMASETETVDSTAKGALEFMAIKSELDDWVFGLPQKFAELSRNRAYMRTQTQCLAFWRHFGLPSGLAIKWLMIAYTWLQST